MSSPDRSIAPPLFVVGCGRSGTTMLRLMLDSHPDLAVPWESHFIVAMWKDRRRYRSASGVDAERMVRDIADSPMFGQWEVPDEVLRRRVEALERPSFSDVIDAVFMSYADSRHKRRWADKTPAYVRSIPLLARLFPGSRFVHVIRDGRDVALSYLSVPWGPSDIWLAARRWEQDVSAGRRDGAKLPSSRYLEVRYEDVIRDPRAALERICAIADLPFDERMLEYHRDGSERLASPEAHKPYHASASKPPTAGLRDWRTQMSEEHLLAFESVAGGLLAELGYERGVSQVPLARRAEAALRMAVLGVRAAASDARKAVERRVGVRRPLQSLGPR
ncbi:MAG TPA: sulfotransferase [Actinomycetota bacterium]|jgi:hypothetical protein